MISTARRVEYALGYLELGLRAEAADELAAVAPADRLQPAVLGARLVLAQAEECWDRVEDLARQILAQDDADAGAWIALGCAVRRSKGVVAARDLLRVLEPRIGATCATLHYNLACYECLTGDLAVARACLKRACEMDAVFKALAKTDPDLQALWGELAAEA